MRISMNEYMPCSNIYFSRKDSKYNGYSLEFNIKRMVLLMSMVVYIWSTIQRSWNMQNNYLMEVTEL